AEMRGSLDLFESMLTGRDHLMGDFGAADIAAFPFVKYAVIPEFSDRYLFHTVLSRYLKIGDRYPRLAAWIARMERRPRVYALSAARHRPPRRSRALRAKRG